MLSAGGIQKPVFSTEYTALRLPPLEPIESFKFKIRKKPSPCCSPRLFLYLIPVINAGVEAIQANYGLQEKPTGLQGTVTSLAFVSSIALGAKFAVGGMVETYKILKTRKLPDEWPALSRRKEIFALSLSVGITAFVATSDALQSYFYTQEMPKEYKFDERVSPGLWKIPCTVIAVSTALGFIFSEGMETYKGMRELISDESKKYANAFSSYASPIAMTAFGYFGSINDIMLSYTGIKDIFNITKAPLVCFNGTFSLFNGVTDFALNARYLRDVIDDVIYHIIHNGLSKKEGFTAAISAGMWGLLFYANERMLDAMWHEFFSGLNISESTVLEPFISTMAWGGAAYYWAVATPCLYPHVYYVIDKTITFGESIIDRCRAATEEVPLVDHAEGDEEQAFFDAPEMMDDPVVSNNRSTLFAQSKMPKASKTRSYCPTHCAIL